MSVQESDIQEIGSEEEVDLSSIEGQVESEGEADQVLESSESQELDVESSETNSTEQEEIEEVDFESIDFEEPAVTQTAKKEVDEEKRKQNDHNAKQRVKVKQLEEQLKTVVSQVDSGFISEDPKPKRDEFFSEDALYGKFNGNEYQARAAYEDALDDWNDRAKQRHLQAVKQLDAQVQHERMILDTEESFEKSASKYSGRVKNFSQNIENARKALTVRGRNGESLDGSMIVKSSYGEDAPIILAAIGASEAIQKRLLNARTDSEVHMILAEVRVKAKNAFSSSKKKISKAGSESAIAGDAGAPLGNLEKAMQKAVDSGDVKEYRRLKGLIAAKSQPKK